MDKRVRSKDSRKVRKERMSNVKEERLDLDAKLGMSRQTSRNLPGSAPRHASARVLQVLPWETKTCVLYSIEQLRDSTI